MKNKLLVVGEVLIDRYNIDNKIEDKVAGAPLNVALVLNHLKKHVHVVGCIGNDDKAKQILDYFKLKKLSTSGLIQIAGATTIANVIIKDGERDFTFQRGADEKLKLNNCQIIDYVKNSEFIHFGSATAFLGGSLLKVYKKFLNISVKFNKTIFFDPNFRVNLYNTTSKINKFIKQSIKFIKHANVIKMSLEEFEIIFNKQDIKQFLNNKKNKQKIFLITLGSQGSKLIYMGKVYKCETRKVKKVIDTTGAGDSFIGSFIAQYHKDMTLNQLKKNVNLANVFSSFVVEKVGLEEALLPLGKYHKLMISNLNDIKNNV